MEADPTAAASEAMHTSAGVENVLLVAMVKVWARLYSWDMMAPESISSFPSTQNSQIPETLTRIDLCLIDFADGEERVAESCNTCIDVRFTVLQVMLHGHIARYCEPYSVLLVVTAPIEANHQTLCPCRQGLAMRSCRVF